MFQEYNKFDNNLWQLFDFSELFKIIIPTN